MMLMPPRLLACAAAAALMLGYAGAAAAADNAAASKLATQHACLGCHAVDKKLVGPAYKDVAAKYKGDPKAIDYLSNKILKGSVGVWGPVAMPPNAGLSAGDAKTLATWVMAGAPAK